MNQLSGKHQRLAIAAAVLAVGLVVALLFPQSRRSEAEQLAQAGNKSGLSAAQPLANAHTDIPSDETYAEDAPADAASPAERRDPPDRSTGDFQWKDPAPPPLDLQYPGQADNLFSSQPFDVTADPAETPRTPPRRMHRIKDGDTLRSLAARFLKDPERADEIFQENRDLLSDPELLPVGAELRIPD